VDVGSKGNTRQVRHVRLGDHLCLPFATDDEQREVLTAYISDGLHRGERVLYLADQTKPEAIGGWLSVRGVDSASAMERGQLQIRNVASEPFAADRFDPDVVITLIRFEVRQARQAGYQGLRLTGEMSWALREANQLPGVNGKRLREFESSVAAAFDTSELVAICQYDERLFDPVDVDGYVAYHPQVVQIDPLHDDRRLRIVPTFRPRGLRVSGVVDDTTSIALTEALERAVRWPYRDITLDLGGLQFIDVAGVRAIVRAAAALEPPRRLQVVRLAPTLRKVIGIIGWDQTPGLQLGDEEVEPT
jgi:anti-anti-sigma regulatory factor